MYNRKGFPEDLIPIDKSLQIGSYKFFAETSLANPTRSSYC